MKSSIPAKSCLSKSFPLSPTKIPKSSDTLESTSTVELPSSLREHFEKTKDFEWTDDSPTKDHLSKNLNSSLQQSKEKMISFSDSIYKDDQDLQLIETSKRDSSKEKVDESITGLLDAPDIFYRRGVFDNHLERIIEEVSNEAFSSFLNQSTVFLNSSLQKHTREIGIHGSLDNLSKDNLISLKAK
jgi:hypothetical protein